MVPKATKDCMNCGLCAKQCPIQAIDAEDVKKQIPVSVFPVCAVS